MIQYYYDRITKDFIAVYLNGESRAVGLAPHFPGNLASIRQVNFALEYLMKYCNPVLLAEVPYDYRKALNKINTAITLVA